jgi:hypothetical protein
VLRADRDTAQLCRLRPVVIVGRYFTAGFGRTPGPPLLIEKESAARLGPDFIQPRALSDPVAKRDGVLSSSPIRSALT